jgi:thioredoxin 1
MLLCFGGVCVPYSAVLPLLFMVLKWVLDKLVKAGLLPAFVLQYLQGAKTPQAEADGDTTTKAKSVNATPCCSATGATEKQQQEGSPTSSSNGVKVLESDREFRAALSTGDFVVCKFTATWCKPCHKIQPVFDEFATHYPAASFFTIDVDDFDDISSRFNVAMMPTFLVLQGDDVKGTYRGSNEHELRTFLKDHVVA